MKRFAIILSTTLFMLNSLSVLAMEEVELPGKTPDEQTRGVYVRSYPKANKIQKWAARHPIATTSALVICNISCAFAPALITDDPYKYVGAGIGLELFVALPLLKHLIISNNAWRSQTLRSAEKILQCAQELRALDLGFINYLKEKGESENLDLL